MTATKSPRVYSQNSERRQNEVGRAEGMVALCGDHGWVLPFQGRCPYGCAHVHFPTQLALPKVASV